MDGLPSGRARALVLHWAERGAVPEARVEDALRAAGALPSAADWRRFADRLLIWAGATLLSIAVVFFFAYNWNAIGKFAQFGLVEASIVAAIAAYWRLGPDRDAGKAALLAASILMGALLALVGQTYQTGADTFELFAVWAALILPWAAVGRFAALWIVWLVLVNLAVVLYLQTSVTFGVVGVMVRERWTLFVLNTAALAIWEAAARQVRWLDERWAPRLIAMASAGLATFIAVAAVVNSRDAAAAFVVYLLWIAAMYGAYRYAIRDLFMLAIGCLSVIVVATTVLGRVLLAGSGAGAGGFLVISLAVIGMSAGAAVWLRSVGAEHGLPAEAASDASVQRRREP